MVDVDNLQLHLSKEWVCRDVFAKQKNCKQQRIITITNGKSPKQKCVTISFRSHRFIDVYGPENGFDSLLRCFFDLDCYNSQNEFLYSYQSRERWLEDHIFVLQSNDQTDHIAGHFHLWKSFLSLSSHHQLNMTWLENLNKKHIIFFKGFFKSHLQLNWTYSWLV